MNPYNHNFAGAKWWKFDFHTHTPASADYRQKDESLKNISSEQWLIDHMQAEIDCVAVTDHNSGEWIDKLKKAYQQLEDSNAPDFRPLFIFPAVEISVSGNIHLLAILDTDKNSLDISNLLRDCGYKVKESETEIVTEKSFIEVVEAIDTFGGIPIPAHVDKKRGLFEKVEGATLKGFLNLPQLYACELEDEDYKFPELYKSEKIDWAFVSGSDSHKPEEVGRAYTWVKMGTPCLEGLKLALMDGGDFSLIRSDKFNSDFNPNAYSDFIIKSIKIEKARYCGKDEPLNIEFNPWLNCIIGGRGTGKSTIIEFLRIVMRKERELKALSENSEPYKTFANFNQIGETREDKGALREDTQVIAKCLLDNSKFSVQWANNGSLPAIIQKDENGNFNKSSGEVSSRFPIRIYSQKQIFETASNPQSLLNIIDKAPETEYRKWKDEHNQICASYKLLKAQIREFETRIKKENELKGNLEDINRKLSIFQQSKHTSLLNLYRKQYNQYNEIESFLSSLTENYQSIKNINIEAASPNLPIFDDTDEIKQIFENYIKKTKEFNNNLSELKIKFHQLIQEASLSFKKTKWQNDFNKTIADFNALKEKLKAEGVANINEYGKFIQAKQITEAEIQEIENLKIKKKTAEQEAESLLNKLTQHRKKLTEQRKEFINKVLKNNHFITIKIEECGYKENLEKSFRNLINCETRFETIIEKLLPELRDPKQRFQKIAAVKTNIKKLKNGESIKGISDDIRFLNRIKKNVSEEMIDDIDLWYPEDKIKVSYKRGKKYEPIEHGSAGQKNASILAFLLEYGKEPIILDQPEDDLDNQLIFDLIVKQIKENKKRRQIIIVTHNPNIVVNGDAEMINVLDFKEGQCKTVAAGCLQEQNIRDEICRIMEGGKVAFQQRFKRINIG
ncbi:MAG: ABC transporter [Deltaproteobacteria bacterium]|nr:ABC transporter [Deltaproteobacteria bacterium]